jgi:hypothetical protein
MIKCDPVKRSFVFGNFISLEACSSGQKKTQKNSKYNPKVAYDLTWWVGQYNSLTEKLWAKQLEVLGDPSG